VAEIAAYLRRHEFRELFTEELGWDHDSGDIEFQIRDVMFRLRVVACKRGFRVLHTSAEHHVLFDRKWLREIQACVFGHAHEHVLIVSCERPQKQVWMWASTSTSRKSRKHREHSFSTATPPAGLLLRLEAMRFTLEEEEAIRLLDAAERVRNALDADADLNLFVRRPWYARRSYELAKARKDGGVEAFQKFVEFHLPMLPRAANRWWKYMRGLDREERIQIVALGLLRAASKYDEDRGAQFSTYAHTALRRAAQRHGTYCTRFVRLPVHLWKIRQKGLADLRAVEIRQDPNGHVTAIDQLAESDRNLLDQLMLIRRTDIIASMNDPTDPAFRTVRLLPAHDGANSSFLERVETTQVVSTGLAEIGERERKVVEMRFGLMGPSYTLEKIAEFLGITRERVRQIELQALDRLRPRLAKSLGIEVSSRSIDHDDERQVNS
jgi:RNA polymerase nonessential primary-like sigma factor